MSRCVVIGHSIYSVKVLEHLRAEHPDMELIVCAQEPGLPYERSRFSEVLAKRIERHEVYYRSEDFYRNLRVQFITDQKISRIHFKRKYITFEDNTKLDFDQLIIANWEKDVWPDIKGLTRRGVFSLRTLVQLDEFLKMIPQIDTVVVQSDGLRGIRIAQSLALRGKEIVLCAPGAQLLPGWISKEGSRRLEVLLTRMGIRVFFGCSVTEVLGETDVRAVRLTIGKVIGCESVVFSDVRADCRFFERFELKCAPLISVDLGMRTSEPCVFALDEVVSQPGGFFGEDAVFLNGQAESLQKSFLGQDFQASSLMPEVLFDIGTNHILIGSCGQLTEGCDQYVREVSEQACCVLALSAERKILSAMTINIADKASVLPAGDLSAPLADERLSEYAAVVEQTDCAQEGECCCEGGKQVDQEEISAPEAC